MSCQKSSADRKLGGRQQDGWEASAYPAELYAPLGGALSQHGRVKTTHTHTHKHASGASSFDCPPFDNVECLSHRDVAARNDLQPQLSHDMLDPSRDSGKIPQFRGA